jgi:hypothetical protein
VENIDNIMTILHKENIHEKSINWKNRDFERSRSTEHTQLRLKRQERSTLQNIALS